VSARGRWGHQMGPRCPTDSSRSPRSSIPRKPLETVPHAVQPSQRFGLITRRSQVQTPPPLFHEGSANGAFFASGALWPIMRTGTKWVLSSSVDCVSRWRDRRAATLAAMCMQCMATAMTSGAVVTGARSWLATRKFSWLTPTRLRRITICLFAAAMITSALFVSGSGRPVAKAHAAAAKSPTATP
jgi:hypothetical protein